MKLSWIWTGGPAEPKEDARSRLQHVSDIFLSVSTPVQQGLEHFLAQSRRIQTYIATRITSNYRFLQEVAQSSPVTVLDVEGGWYVVLRLPAIVSSEEWALRLLRDQNVHVHPGYLFDFATEPFLVMSLLPAEADFRAGISRLLSAVEVATSHKVSRGD
jgi:aspartate/methionine/tyrosine aminotransferase